jgi:pimeloyl-ACP methyl ester carboxylesterase
MLAPKRGGTPFRQLGALLASLLPNSRTLEVPEASHVMHVENPSLVNAAVLRFLDEVCEGNR